MKCKCITNIEKAQLSDGVSKRTGKKVTSFEFTEESVGDFMDLRTGKQLGPKTKSNVRYTLEGQKKIYRSFMPHAYCPFCGKKY